MKFEINNEHGHYALYVNDIFYGNYDTFTEAVDEMEEIKKDKESAA